MEQVADLLDKLNELGLINPTFDQAKLDIIEQLNAVLTSFRLKCGWNGNEWDINTIKEEDE